MAVDEQFLLARRLIGSAVRIAVLTGAGISTDSGIPDFRGPNGLWVRDRAAERRSSLEAYRADAELRAEAWRHFADAPVRLATPNAGHRALVALESQDRLEALITQNTDGLHLLAGHEPERVVELHGSVRLTRCERCRAELATEQVLARVRAGEGDPRCAEILGGARCGGLLRRATVLFGEPLDRRLLAKAAAGVRSAELLVAVGTTLGVYPAAGLVGLAHELQRPVLIVNRGPTELDHLASARLDGSIGELLPALVA